MKGDGGARGSRKTWRPNPVLDATVPRRDDGQRRVGRLCPQRADIRSTAVTTTRRSPPRIRRLVADAEPAKRLRQALQEERAKGRSFRAAWQTALDAACAGIDDQRELKTWRGAFSATRPAWRSAFLR